MFVLSLANASVYHCVMLRTLQAWLNGTRHYRIGVELLKLFSKDQALLTSLAKGESLYNKWKLQEELTNICKNLKSNNDTKATILSPTTQAGIRPVDKTAEEKVLTGKNTDELTQLTSEIFNTTAAILKNIKIANPELHKACLAKAKLVYKQAMNERAKLFDKIPADKYTDVNRPDLVQARSDQAILVCKLFNEASQLFDDADFVKLHGVLPTADKIADEINPYEKLKDHELTRALDNLRKNINKIKKREQTPKRIALLQKRSVHLKYLEERCHSLKHSQ